MGNPVLGITFQYREGDEAPEGGGCPIGGRFVPTTSEQLFAGKRVVVFSLPGAFTPTCSSQQVPGFEAEYDNILSKGIDEIYVSAVNDGFVMNAWAADLGISKVKVIPDGNGQFAASLGQLSDFSAVGFGMRSLRFAVILNNAEVEKMFIEPAASDADPDPYGESSPEKVIEYLDSIPTE